MEKIELRPEHEWLQRFVGDWSWEAEVDHGPDAPVAGPMTGTERVRSLDGAWIVCEGESEYAGQRNHSVITLGFDPMRNRFVGTYVGSMMTHLWVYDGRLDSEQRVLTLDCEGPSFADPKVLVPYRDVFEMDGPDHRTLRAEVRHSDGSWHHFMTTRYTRVR